MDRQAACWFNEGKPTYMTGGPVPIMREIVIKTPVVDAGGRPMLGDDGEPTYTVETTQEPTGKVSFPIDSITAELDAKGIAYQVMPLAEARAWQAANTVKTPEQLQVEFTALVQARLDNFARTKTYDNMLSLCTYATSTNAVFAAEGQYGVEARDATWTKANAVLGSVLAGQRPVPTWAELEAELPVLAWPVVGAAQ